MSDQSRKPRSPVSVPHPVPVAQSWVWDVQGHCSIGRSAGQCWVLLWASMWPASHQGIDVAFGTLVCSTWLSFAPGIVEHSTLSRLWLIFISTFRAADALCNKIWTYSSVEFKAAVKCTLLLGVDTVMTFSVQRPRYIAHSIPACNHSQHNASKSLYATLIHHWYAKHVSLANMANSTVLLQFANQ